MAQSLRSQPKPNAQRTNPTERTQQPTEPSHVETCELLDVLGDEYASQILEMLIEESRTGRELQAETEMSKATIYRRLDKLEAAELIAPTMKVDADGHHRQEYHAIVAGVHVGFSEEGLSARIEYEEDTGNTAQKKPDYRRQLAR